MNPISKAVKVTVTMPVSVTYNGRVKNHPPYSPLTKGGHRGVRLGRNGLRNRGRLTYLLFFALLFCLPSSLQARVTGNCSNCHTMHNSQGGTAMAWEFSGGSFQSRATPYGRLLRSDCIGCHTATDNSTWKSSIGAPIVYNTNQPNYGDYQPDNKRIGLAAGNFYWTTADSGADSTTSRGHSLSGISGDKTGWPGTSASSCGVCHCNTVGCIGLGQGCKSCHLPAHHKGDFSGGWADADDGYYRFLGPLTSYSDSHKWGVRGYEDPDWQKTSGSSDHNEYSGEGKAAPYFSISHFCAGCHYYYSGISDPRWCRKFRVNTTFPPIYHQATLILPDPTSPGSNYKGYVGYNEHPSGPWDYDPKLPIARTNISTGSYPGSQVNHSSTDALMCLTCHRAHASPYNKMLRWDNTLVLADQGTYYGCLGCHSPDPKMPP